MSTQFVSNILCITKIRLVILLLFSNISFLFAQEDSGRLVIIQNPLIPIIVTEFLPDIVLPIPDIPPNISDNPIIPDIDITFPDVPKKPNKPYYLPNRVYKVNGYRIQILQTTDRKIANQQKAIFLQQFMNAKVYMSFESPNFRIRIGDFKTYSDANKQLSKVRKAIGQAFIVKDEITIIGSGE